MNSQAKYAIGNEVLVERNSIDKNYFGHSPDRWITLIVDEIGSAANGILAANADLPHDLPFYRQSLLRVAALAEAAIESFDNTVYKITQVPKPPLGIKRDLYHKLYVPTDSTIRDFVEAKTLRLYIPGSTFYEITSKTRLKGDKEILTERSDGQIMSWGLRESGVMIHEGVGRKTVYIQSTSSNRRLKASTHILVRK